MIANRLFPGRILFAVAGVIVVDQQVLLLCGQGIGQFPNQVTLAGPSRKDLVQHGIRSGQLWQGVRRCEQHVVGPRMVNCGNEPCQVKVGHGLLERLRGTVAGNRLGGPVNADAELALGQPVGAGTDVGTLFLCASQLAVGSTAELSTMPTNWRRVVWITAIFSRSVFLRFWLVYNTGVLLGIRPIYPEAAGAPSIIASEIHAKRDFHNPRLKSFWEEHGIPLADICCLLRDERFGDELHPNDRGAKIIAEVVFQVLPKE